MAPLAARGCLLAFASPTQILLCNIREETWKIFDIPFKAPVPKPAESNGVKTTAPKNNSETANATGDYSHVPQGTCLAFSHCGSLLAACTESKQLIILQTSDLNIVQTWEVPRKISTLTFTKNADRIVTADKAGDAYIYQLNSPTPGSLILGHLSMVLDMVLSEDGKLVLTADRDEKVRVSHFPNSYNIHNYCLGHTEFVNTISLLPSNPDILISGSGDGTLKLWHYVSGKLLATEELKRQDQEKLAIRKVVVTSSADGNSSIAAVLLNTSNSITFYKIVMNGNTPHLESQIVELNSQPLDLVFLSDGSLVTINADKNSPVTSLVLTEETKHYVIQETSFLLKLTSSPEAKKILSEIPASCAKDISPLFKRWFDNMQAYQERKNERIKSEKTKGSEREQKRIKIDSDTTSN